MKKKKSNKKVKIRVSVSKYFILLTVLLIPTVYFVVKGSSEPVWNIIPPKIQPLLINGNDALSGISQSYICSYIFYVIINFLPERKKQIEDSKNFLLDVQTYMAAMYAIIGYDLSNEISFYNQLYNIPKKPDGFKPPKELENIDTVLNLNYVLIENKYDTYISEKKSVDYNEDYVKEIREQLQNCANRYQEYSMKIYRFMHPDMYEKDNDSK